MFQAGDDLGWDASTVSEPAPKRLPSKEEIVASQAQHFKPRSDNQDTSGPTEVTMNVEQSFD